MIAHTGSHTRDIGPHCANCQSRTVRFEGAVCSLCRNDKEKRNLALAVFFFVVVMSGVTFAVSQAIGTWLWFNVDKPKLEEKLNVQN